MLTFIDDDTNTVDASWSELLVANWFGKEQIYDKSSTVMDDSRIQLILQSYIPYYVHFFSCQGWAKVDAALFFLIFSACNFTRRA